MLWGMPAVNYDMMFQAMVRDTKAGPGSNKVVYWSRPFGWKNQTLTPNPDTIYLMPFINTKDVRPNGAGSSTRGQRNDCWFSGRLLAGGPEATARREWIRVRAASISSCRPGPKKFPRVTLQCRRRLVSRMRFCVQT